MQGSMTEVTEQVKDLDTETGVEEDSEDLETEVTEGAEGQQGARPKTGTSYVDQPEDWWFPPEGAGRHRRRAGRLTAWHQGVGEAMSKSPRPENLAEEVAGVKDDLRELKAMVASLMVQRPIGPGSQPRRAPTAGTTPAPRQASPVGDDETEEDEDEEESNTRPPSRPGDAAGIPRRRRGESEALRELLAGKLEAKFNGDPEQLPFFLAQVAGHMRARGNYFPDEAEKVRCVAGRLEGQAAQWLVQLYDCGARELRSLSAFMTALRARFEDPFRVDRAKAKFAAIQQGNRSVAEYVLEFRSVAAQIPDYPEAMKSRQFQDGLRTDLLEWILMKANPEGLQEWIRWAGEAETTKERIRLAKQRAAFQQGKGTGTPSRDGSAGKAKTSAETEKQRRMRLGLCLACGKKGHLIASCPEKVNSQGLTRAPTGTQGGAAKGTAGQATAQTGGGEERPTGPAQEPAIPDVVSGGVPLYFLEVKLGHKLKGTTEPMMAALDSGCTRCLISQRLVKSLRIEQEPLPELLPFLQMDGTVLGGNPAVIRPRD